MRLSEHFTVAEMLKSATADRLGIPNIPTTEVLANLARLADLLEGVRALTGKPLSIKSGYRSPALNSAVGGSPSSYHMLGLAADFDPPAGWTHDGLQQAIGASPLQFDLCLEERAKDGAHWLHLQASKPGATPRRLIRDAELDKLGGTITRMSAD